MTTPEVDDPTTTTFSAVTELDDELTLALELADLADAATMPRFRAADLRVDHKADASEVTEADRGAEAAIAGPPGARPPRPRGARRGGGAAGPAPTPPIAG